MVMQQKTERAVQFEIAPSTRAALESWIKSAGLHADDYLFPSRLHASPHLGARQFARIVNGWVEEIGLDPVGYGRIRFGVPSRHSSTDEPRTFEQFSFYSAASRGAAAMPALQRVEWRQTSGRAIFPLS